MIVEFEKIKENISRHIFLEKGSSDFSAKTKHLEESIRKSVYEKAEAILGRQKKIHMALSGGIDSSTLLMMLSGAKIPLVAHTIASNDKHPDVYYSSMLTGLFGIEHMIHVSKFPDGTSMYEALFKELSSHTQTIICGDCIDELLGGYYAHMDPKRFGRPGTYDASLPLVENRHRSLVHHMNGLIENHLLEQNRYSTQYGIDVFLPYADERVFYSAAKFSVNQLVYGSKRKKPMLAIAKRTGVPDEIILRRKYGLVNAKDPIINYTYVDETPGYCSR